MGHVFHSSSSFVVVLVLDWVAPSVTGTLDRNFSKNLSPQPDTSCGRDHFRGRGRPRVRERLSQFAPSPSSSLLTAYCLLIRLAPYPDLFCHVNKLDNGLSLHFAHDVGAMDFYGNLAAPQLSGDLFVKQT